MLTERQVLAISSLITIAEFTDEQCLEVLLENEDFGLMMILINEMAHSDLTQEGLDTFKESIEKCQESFNNTIQEVMNYLEQQLVGTEVDISEDNL